ncbi:nitroreductase family protein [Streptomyces sp. SP2-10]|uniref:nitroreductase family protein n=1 Tax=Streptomyces sp. SP2-10 TaxID=2873385 RepID=UPI001CA747D7|nr:nitroreductase family protein [Streptomyces sp. SP2-10]MBY8845717.1 nitroreductase family protein [Streptomyces sp. SP2-10]
MQGNLTTPRAVPAASPGRESEGRAADLWARVALPAAAPEPPAEPVAAPGLRLALSLLEEGALTSRANRSCGSYAARAVPSAGAVYPYEFAVLVMENGVPTAFRVDVDRRICARLAAGTRVTTALDASMLAIPENGGALVITLTRPWLSMRKYGDRGYLYTQIDAGHAAGNLLLAAAGRGAAGALRLRFPRETLSELLEAGENCREIYSATLIPANPAGEPSTRWTVHDDTDRERRGPTWRSWLESTCWDSLAGWTEHSASAALRTVAAPLARIRTGRRPAGGHSGLGDPSEWPELIGTRASSKAFTGEPVSASAVWQAVSALSTPLQTDLPDASPLSATLVLRSTTEPEQNAVYRLHTGERQPGSLPTTEEVARACMQQRALAGAAAILLLHVPRTSLAGAGSAAGTENLRELAFRCGALGQLLYLGANRATVGVTAIGGFDVPLWRTLAGLPEDEEILYALLLGRPDDSGIKFDRLATAHAQNER